MLKTYAASILCTVDDGYNILSTQTKLVQIHAYSMDEANTLAGICATQHFGQAGIDDFYSHEFEIEVIEIKD